MDKRYVLSWWNSLKSIENHVAKALLSLLGKLIHSFILSVFKYFKKVSLNFESKYSQKKTTTTTTFTSRKQDQFSDSFK
jgi:hypothetical protein